ncbi:hypothetical protein AALP_AA3G146400 [Arabis alpina]|uniref:Aldehyde oxidase/xanthine dehydrogenase second molybdopterin binding domain-containing protein n=1 Tax=Arabis alpina TaxID=50452 RepID=A0A087H976_ARAAL|nr:hypothetical protein AALP_AA3G146400 [Arabis alpina]
MKSMPVAAACALPASKMQRTVYVNRRTDMITTGGRHPMKVTYSVGFKSNGNVTGLDVEVLVDAGRLRLFHNAKAGESPEYTLPLIWDKLAEFKQRRMVVEEFNATNKWRKRGISRVPAIYGVSMRSAPGRVKQMAAISLGLIQCGTTSDELLEKIRVVQSDTLSMVQGSITGGSTTSEISCEAVRICRDGLVERLLPVKTSLVETVTWENLISLSAIDKYVEVNILTGETTILRTDIIYDCGKSLNPAVDLGQIEGAFVQGVGFFMLEECLMNSDGLVVTDSTWTYKIPTVDTIPRQFNVEILNSGQHKNRILSSKASGEPPLLLASSVYCAVRAAVKEARKQIVRCSSNSQQGIDLSSDFELPVPARMPVVKEFCGLSVVEKYLEWKIQQMKNI